MAGKHGGKRNPSPATPPGGPGKFSRRTDGQAVRTEGLSNPEVQYGDVKAMREAQQISPLPGPTPIRPPVARGPVEATPGQGFPAAMFAESNSPQTPFSTGLPVGDGPGPEVLRNNPGEPDMREAVLTYLAQQYGNEDAATMLDEIRESRREPPLQPAPQMAQDPEILDPELFGPMAEPLDVRNTTQGVEPAEADFEDDELDEETLGLEVTDMEDDVEAEEDLEDEEVVEEA